jgi:hypothetical protein
MFSVESVADSDPADQICLRRMVLRWVWTVIHGLIALRELHVASSLLSPARVSGGMFFYAVLPAALKPFSPVFAPKHPKCGVQHSNPAVVGRKSGCP